MSPEIIDNWLRLIYPNSSPTTITRPEVEAFLQTFEPQQSRPTTLESIRSSAQGKVAAVLSEASIASEGGSSGSAWLPDSALDQVRDGNLLFKS